MSREPPINLSDLNLTRPFQIGDQLNQKLECVRLLESLLQRRLGNTYMEKRQEMDIADTLGHDIQTYCGALALINAFHKKGGASLLRIPVSMEEIAFFPESSGRSGYRHLWVPRELQQCREVTGHIVEKTAAYVETHQAELDADYAVAQGYVNDARAIIEAAQEAKRLLEQIPAEFRSSAKTQRQ